jgi:hypothetical protein
LELDRYTTDAERVDLEARQYTANWWASLADTILDGEHLPAEIYALCSSFCGHTVPVNREPPKFFVVSGLVE